MLEGDTNHGGEYLAAESPLLVFVSSVISGMEHDRAAVKQAVQATKLARPWIFESTPPSSASFEESYLSYVRKCDIFVLLVGGRYSVPVEKELQTAKQNHRPLLVFVRKDEHIPELMALVKSVKYYEYSSVDELKAMTLNAILDEVKRSYRSAIPRQDTPSAVRTRDLTKYFAYFTLGPVPSPHQSSIELLAEPFDAHLAIRPGNSSDPPKRVREVRFDDFDEALEAFGIFNKVLQAGNPPPGLRPATAQRQLIEDEMIPALSRYMAAKAMGKDLSGRRDQQIGYMVFGTRAKYARLLNACRLRKMVDRTEVPIDSSIKPICFPDFLGLELWLDMVTDMAKAGEDREKALQIAAQAALKYALYKRA